MTQDKCLKIVLKNIKYITKNSNITPESTQENTEGWDSLAYMTIVAMVEKNFKVKITPNNIIKFDSVKSIVDLIK